MVSSTNPSWERTKNRIVITVGSTLIDAWICSNYTTEFLKQHLIENTKLIIKNDDQAIPDLLRSFTY